MLILTRKPSKILRISLAVTERTLGLSPKLTRDRIVALREQSLGQGTGLAHPDDEAILVGFNLHRAILPQEINE
jgi:hypothetical protein